MHIHYLVDGPVSRNAAGWTSPLASLRYRVLLPATELSRQGIKIQLKYARAPVEEHERNAADNLERPDVLCVSKCFYPPAQSVIESYARAGVPIVADFCDDHFQSANQGPLQRAIAKAARQIVVSTPTMAVAVREATGRDAVVIDDPFEGPPGQPKFSPSADELALLWFGHPTNLDTLAPMFQQLAHWMTDGLHSQGRRIALTIVTQIDQRLRDYLAHVRNAFPRPITIKPTEWSVGATWTALAATDAVLLPSQPSQVKVVKSANRLVECLRAGRLAIAHPVPSYSSLADYAFVDGDIGHGLSAALADVAGAEARVMKGHAWVNAKASPAQCARRWREVFESIAGGGKSSPS